jgi:hypothetical protein
MPTDLHHHRAHHGTHHGAQPRAADARGFHVLMALGGLWFIFSPLMVGEPFDSAGVWNNRSVGATVALLAVLGLCSKRCCIPTRAILGFLGMWIAASPWVFGYADRLGRLASSIMIGLFITFCALAGAALTPSRQMR